MRSVTAHASHRAPRPIRVLIVDDSKASRKAIEEVLNRAAAQVVGHAADGEEALRLVLELKPDCICLDLEMPRMDGFTFLRVLMTKRPTPVVVVSSYARKPEVFKALELGALDFVRKPSRELGQRDLEALQVALISKLATVRLLRIQNLSRGTPAPAAPRIATPRTGIRQIPKRVAVIGASTGGPTALAQLLRTMPRDLSLGYAVAQHMPERFTRTFAERLGRQTGLDVCEAAEGDALWAGRVLIAPGGRHLRLMRESADAPLRAVLAPAGPTDAHAYCPSADVLFETAASALGARVCALVLTGMGEDGRRGVRLVKEAGGLTLAESKETAVVFGMPRAAVATGCVDEVLDLPQLSARLRQFAEGAEHG